MKIGRTENGLKLHKWFKKMKFYTKMNIIMYYYIISFKTTFICYPAFLCRHGTRRFFFVLVYYWWECSVRVHQPFLERSQSYSQECSHYKVTQFLSEVVLLSKSWSRQRMILRMIGEFGPWACSGRMVLDAAPCSLMPSISSQCYGFMIETIVSIENTYI